MNLIILKISLFCNIYIYIYIYINSMEKYQIKSKHIQIKLTRDCD